MKLKDLVEICYGRDQKQVEVEDSVIPIYGTGGIIGCSSKFLYDKQSVLIGRKGTINRPFYVDKPFWTIDTLFYTKINTSLIIPKYLYYQLCSINLSQYSEGAAVPSLTTKTLYDLDINVPNTKVQQHIVNTIGTIDDLIENKQKTIDKIKQLSSVLYKKNLLKASNIISLGDVCEIRTGKLNADAATNNGIYPFFTCGQETLFIDEYSFEGKNIIVAGNGEISVKYYEGRCNAYQRTYMLCPKKYFFLFLKELEYSISNLKNNSQGSVIKFITKGMLESIKICLNENSGEIENKIKSLYENISLLEKEITLLKNNKEKLLSKYF